MPTATEITANVNSADCLRSQSDVGQTIIHNICTGVRHAVPWGGADWLGFWALVLVGLIVVLILSALAYMTIDSVRGY